MQTVQEASRKNAPWCPHGSKLLGSFKAIGESPLRRSLSAAASPVLSMEQFAVCDSGRCRTKIWLSNVWSGVWQLGLASLAEAEAGEKVRFRIGRAMREAKRGAKQPRAETALLGPAHEMLTVSDCTT